MRARTLVFALVCGTATAALAQSGGYVRFSAANADACAMACASDQMCASWSFGNAARSYGQSQSGSGGMCTFSSSPNPGSSPGVVSGLPRRGFPQQSVPMMSAPPRQNAQNYTSMGGQPQVNRASAPQSAAPTNSRNAPSGWEVRPAPWLRNVEPSYAPQQTQSQGAPQQIAPPLPSPVPYNAPRIEYESQNRAPQPQPAPQYRPAPQYQPTPQYTPSVPVYSPPPIPSAPVMIAPPRRPETMPAPPPNTQQMPEDTGEANVAPAAAPVPPRPRAGRGVPRPKSGRVATPATTPPQQPQQIAPAPVAPAPVAATPPPAAPPRQETAARPSTGRGAPRPPVRDASNPESFRGADGMIDAAEMRRAQLEAARAQGTPSYSVQREWEAVAAEQQRAEAAGEVRVDPLAGSAPVPLPPETRAERRAREAEEAAEDVAEARASGQEGDEEAAAARPPARGARGVPRTRTPPSDQSSETQEYERQVAADRAKASAAPRRRAPSPAPRPALDREPRLSGGPG